MTREEVTAMFATYGAVIDLKHFPSTEYYRSSGALVQMESPDHANAAIQALNGFMLPGATQPLLVRFADSPAEKAAKAARKERQAPLRLGSLGPAAALQEQLQRQLLELSLQAGVPAGHGPAGGGLSSAGSLPTQLPPSLAVGESAFAAWSGAAAAPALPPPRGHAGQGCSIYIKGMPEDADKLWLYEKFARFGGILSVRVLVDEHTGKCNGIGFVNYTDPEGSRAAHETMNGVGMGDRLLHVMIQNTTPSANGRGSRQHSVRSAPMPLAQPLDRAASYGSASFGAGW